MGRHQEKIKPVDIKYSVLASSYDRHPSTAEATIKHRERGRVRRRLNIAKFESRRTGNDELYIDAGVNEIMKILGV